MYKCSEKTFYSYPRVSVAGESRGQALWKVCAVSANKHSFNEKTNEATVDVLSTKNITSQSLRARKIYDARISIRWLRVRIISELTQQDGRRKKTANLM